MTVFYAYFGSQIKPFMRSNSQLLQAAASSLNGKWGLAIGGFIIVAIIQVIAGSFGMGLASIVIAGPMAFGQAFFFMALSRGDQPVVDDLFSGFKRFGALLLLAILQMVIIFSGVILLVIPGIIASVGLSMAYFIAVDRPELEAPDVLRASWDLVWKGGYFWKVFGFALLAGLLSIAGALCLGIGLLFTTPIILVGQAMLYDELRSSSSEVVD